MLSQQVSWWLPGCHVDDITQIRNCHSFTKYHFVPDQLSLLVSWVVSSSAVVPSDVPLLSCHCNVIVAVAAVVVVAIAIVAQICRNLGCSLCDNQSSARDCLTGHVGVFGQLVLLKLHCELLWWVFISLFQPILVGLNKFSIAVWKHFTVWLAHSSFLMK